MKIIIKTLVIAALAIVSCKENTPESVDLEKQDQTDKPLLATNENVLEIPETKTFYVNAQSGLSLREGITLRSKKKLTLPYGAQVTQLSTPAHTTMTVEGITGDMVEVDYQGAKGFVFNGYLTAMAPPLKDETVAAYAARISSEHFPVSVRTKQNKKGAAYGMTTTLTIPARSWNEAYAVAQQLFDLPKSLRLDLTKKTQGKVENSNKLRKTLIDAVAVYHTDNNKIDRVVYDYALKGYSRQVIVKKAASGFELSEVEVSN